MSSPRHTRIVRQGLCQQIHATKVRANCFLASVLAEADAAMLMSSRRRELRATGESPLRQAGATTSGGLQAHMSDDTGHKMSRTELIIQLVKVALGLVIGAYFVWWSLEVLQRLPPH
jgi:hypothetical protein